MGSSVVTPSEAAARTVAWPRTLIARRISCGEAANFWGIPHSDAAKKRWQAFYSSLSKEDKKLYRKGGGDFPRKRT
jgi:hypothetical protein